MRVNFTFRNMDSSEGMKNYAEDKVSRLQKFLRVPLDAEITFSTERHLHCIDVNLNANGKRFAGHEESDDMYASIDLVMDKINRQVRDANDAQRAKRRS